MKILFSLYFQTVVWFAVVTSQEYWLKCSIACIRNTSWSFWGFNFLFHHLVKILVNVSCHSLCHGNSKLDVIVYPSSLLLSLQKNLEKFLLNMTMKFRKKKSIFIYFSLSSNKCWLLGGRKLLLLYMMEVSLFSLYQVLCSEFNLAKLSFSLEYWNQLTFMYTLQFLCK